MHQFASDSSGTRRSGLWFALFVGTVCLWVLSLPLFPTHALLLNAPMLTPMSRQQADTAFDPYLWANVLPLVRQDDLVLNAPWLQLSISPLRAAPGSPVLEDTTAFTAIPPRDPPPLLDRMFPGPR